MNVIDFVLHIDEHLLIIAQTYGTLSYGILAGILFMETGLVFTPFLPGDSLLFASGAFASLGSFNLTLLLGLLWLAAFLGDTVNYWIGHFFGQKIIDNPKIPFINQEHIDKTQAFYKKHGGKTIILARFVPIVRTFAPIVAGAGKMHYQKFISFNVIGGALWALGITYAGYFLGGAFESMGLEIDQILLPIIALIILISITPPLIHILKNKKTRDAFWEGTKREIRSIFGKKK